MQYPHIRQRQSHIKKQRSSKQIRWNNAFTACVNVWNVLTAEKKSTWHKMRERNETNYNAFLRINLYRYFNGLDIISHPSGEY